MILTFQPEGRFEMMTPVCDSNEDKANETMGWVEVERLGAEMSEGCESGDKPSRVGEGR